MNTKRNYLYISELAQLLGVSVKTVRHYHKMGLLPEPERTEAGYRLYEAWHLQRLKLIRQMRDLGLSLSQIRSILSTDAYQQRLAHVLRDALDDIEGQIQELQERRDALQSLLKQENLNLEDLRKPSNLYLQAAQESLGHLLPDLDPAILEQEAVLEALFGDYQWAGGIPEQFQAALAWFQAHPEAYQAYVGDIAALWPLLQDPASRDEALKAAADDFVEKHRLVLDFLMSLGGEGDAPALLEGMLTEIISGSQLRFQQFLAEAYQRKQHD